MAKKTNTGKELSIADILKKKDLITDSNSYYSEYFGADIKIEKIDASKVVAIMNNKEATEYDQYKELIYNSCPIFRAKELISKLEVENPYDVVDVAFNSNYCEIFELGNKILERYGFTSQKVDKVKKQ